MLTSGRERCTVRRASQRHTAARHGLQKPDANSGFACRLRVKARATVPRDRVLGRISEALLRRNPQRTLAACRSDCPGIKTVSVSPARNAATAAPERPVSFGSTTRRSPKLRTCSARPSRKSDDSTRDRSKGASRSRNARTETARFSIRKHGDARFMGRGLHSAERGHSGIQTSKIQTPGKRPSNHVPAPARANSCRLKKSNVWPA